MSKEQARHMIRIAVIVLLLIAAVLLCWQSGYFSGFGDRLRPDTDVDTDAGGTLPQLSAAEKAAFARPDAVLLRRENGTAAAQYSGEALREAMQSIAPSLGEALGTAANPAHITESTFRAGLAEECVYLYYPSGCPLRLLADWLGSEMSSAGADMDSDMLCLSLAEDTVLLCFRDSSGQFFRCTTAAVSETLRARIAEAEGYDALFAFEDGSLDALPPYTVVLREMPEVRALESAPVRDGLDSAELLRAVGMNSFVSSSYVEADGTAVFIQDDMTLRLGADGVLSFHAEGQSARQQAAQNLVDAVNYACAVVSRIAGDRCGDAELRFVGAVYSVEERQYTLSFEYCVDGIPVSLPGDCAAQLLLRGGSLAELRFALRRYSLTEESAAPLPMQQAAAILNADGGGAPELRYIDGGDSVECVWVKG